MSSNKIKLSNQNGDLRFREMVWVWIPPIWRAVLSLFYPPVIIRGKNGKNSESPVGSNKNEKRKPKSAVYRSFWASVVYFHLRLISTKSHKREMTRNQFGSNPTWVRIPPAAPESHSLLRVAFFMLFCRKSGISPDKKFRNSAHYFCIFSHFSSFHSLIFSGVLPQFYPFSTSSWKFLSIVCAEVSLEE